MKFKKYSEDGFGVVFTDGTRIETIHNQDCCEEVYADWTCLVDTAFEDLEFDKLEIVPCSSSYGVMINGFLVNCYNTQNGYYSNNLMLYVIDKDSIVIDELDLTGCTYDTTGY